MFLIRTVFWFALIILLLPTDPHSQRAFIETVQSGAHRAASLCERNGALCDKGWQAWTYLRNKAVSATALASDLLVSESSPAPSASEWSGARVYARREEAIRTRAVSCNQARVYARREDDVPWKDSGSGD